MKKDTHEAISSLHFRSMLSEGCNPLSLRFPKQFYYSRARKRHVSWRSPVSQLGSQSPPSQACAPPPILRGSLTPGNFCKSQPSKEKWWVWTINPSPERTAIKKRPLPTYSHGITVKNNNNELNICQECQTCLKKDKRKKKGRSDQKERDWDQIQNRSGKNYTISGKLEFMLAAEVSKEWVKEWDWTGELSDDMGRAKKKSYWLGWLTRLKNQEEKEMKTESGVKKTWLVYQQGEADNDTDQDSDSSPATCLVHNVG